ncbi:SRR1 family protein [Schizosaccharomyces cryophilus OY26]|uniref:SRR1 family protein n=1 Tax=Schizosaccharomyces cryophilus (strain OY26 / ATCC MYA-4695 / CBS 11777 / NBRC 106824 / NRRL Y48691) TaxID=653667 RepID=S9X6V7_SCHCR|nr:SRR1 family protein [Schizosaccharomyces cryophilus OY26]EPY49511.1 SRR1 family protein [Schizosaccharomyces cryophilus OY26]
MDFVLVTNPRRRKKGTVGKGKNVSKKNADIDKELWSQEALEKKLAKNEDRFHVERYLKKIRSLLEPQALQFNHCLSLGLGRLHTVTASLQLQLFFELQSIFKIPSSNCSFYDPAFLEDDIQFLQNKGFTILRDSPKLECLENTLLYMPHCPTSLYEQWLDVYSRSEKQFSMCGNNLQLYVDNLPSKDIKSKYPNIYRVCQKKLYTQILFPEFSEAFAFNDLSFHFPYPPQSDEHPKKTLPEKTPSTVADASNVAEHPN